MPKAGDIVIYRYSHAKNPKNKLYKVAELVHPYKVRCVNIHGKSVVFDNYCVQTIEEHERTLFSITAHAIREVTKAEAKVRTSQMAMKLFEEHKSKASSYFPTV